jgi:hypothetical protein
MTPDKVVASAPEDHVVTGRPVEGVVAGGPDDRGRPAGTTCRRLRRAGGQSEAAEKNRDAAGGDRQTEGSLMHESLVHDDLPF